MDSTDNAFSALDAIDTVAFKVGLKGYNVDEVDEFLERLSGEARQLKDLLAQQRQQLRQAAGRIDQLEGGRAPAVAPAPAPAPAPATAVAPSAAPAPRPMSATAGAERVTSMIAMAQQFIEHAQEEAEAKARELTVAAQERAREIVTEARSRAEDEVNRLNGLKQRLGEDVEKLARQLETERTRLGAALSEFSRWVDATLRVGGAGRPSAPPPSTSAPAATAPTRPAPPPAAPPEADPPAIAQVLRFDGSSDERS